MANTFLPRPRGIGPSGKSLAEEGKEDLAATALRIMDKAGKPRTAPSSSPSTAVVAYHFRGQLAPSHAYGLDAIPGRGQ